MNHVLRPLFLALLVAAPVVAAAQVHGGNTVRCGVTDMGAFEAFVSGKPTPVEFRAAYSCLGLVLPGDLSTSEVRTDNSRYFARLDEHGRIVGGRFQ